MKNLKYLQLFEAFESQKLSKTLKFINKVSSENFMQGINRIANRFDFPISKFNDDMFEYLPFKSALKKNAPPPKQPEREVCNRESDWIPGEFCQGGRVKRTWGEHTRMTECPGCRGTGFKPLKKIQPDVSLVKFWFDKDGNWVTVTGCDGQIRPQNKNVTSGKAEDLYEFSKDLEDYNQIRSISVSELLELPTGSIVLFCRLESPFRPKNQRKEVVSMVFRGRRRNGSDSAYMLQNEFAGTSPSEDGLIHRHEWEKYANYSWCVTGVDDFGSATLLEPKVKREVKPKREIKPLPEEEAYTWNNLIDLRYMQMNTKKDMESQLKNAHFAIILDLNKLKESEFEKLSSTKSERELRKAGAFLKPEEVKYANIERYMDLLIKRFDANKGLSELNKVLPRAFGYTNMLTFVIRGFNFRDMDEMINALYSFMRHPNSSSEKTVIYHLSNIYETSRNRCENVNTTTDEVWKLLDKGGNGKMLDEKSKKYFETYCEISELLFKKVRAEKIETLTDIETLMTKLRSIKQFLENTRFDSLRRQVRYIGEYLGSSYPAYVIQYVREAIEDYPDAQSEIEELKKVIEKTI